MSSKCSHATVVLKTALKRAFQNTAEATGHLTGHKIADKFTKVLRISPQNNLEKLKMSIPKKYLERKLYISRRKAKIYWWSEINIIIH